MAKAVLEAGFFSNLGKKIKGFFSKKSSNQSNVRSYRSSGVLKKTPSSDKGKKISEAQKKRWAAMSDAERKKIGRAISEGRKKNSNSKTSIKPSKKLSKPSKNPVKSNSKNPKVTAMDRLVNRNKQKIKNKKNN